MVGKTAAKPSARKDAVTNYRKSKDSDALQASKKALENENKEVRNSVDGIAKAVREDSPDVSEKIIALQKLEADYHQESWVSQPCY